MLVLLDAATIQIFSISAKSKKIIIYSVCCKLTGSQHSKKLTSLHKKFYFFTLISSMIDPSHLL